MAEIIVLGKKKLLHLDGSLIYHHYTRNGSSYWQCRQKPACTARAITEIGPNNTIRVRKRPAESDHPHAPNREEVTAEKFMSGIKRRATDHPEDLNDLPECVLDELPSRENVKKTIQRERLAEMPSNPTSIEELGCIPHKFTVTSQQQPFLLYDSLQDDDYDQDKGRILLFATQENLRLLFRSRIWYVDGTFKSAPAIFFQLFAIMGSVIQRKSGLEKIIALPLVYALLESKETYVYEVLNVVMSEATNFGIQAVRAVPPRYPPALWNQYNSVLQ